MIFLDSNIIISILRNRGKYQEYLESLKNKFVAITSVTIFELYVGAELSKNKANQCQLIKNLTLDFPIFHLTSQSAIIAASIFAKLQQSGSMIELPDIYIAAIVIENDSQFLTENTKHFSKIQNLKLFSI